MATAHVKNSSSPKGSPVTKPRKESPRLRHSPGEIFLPIFYFFRNRIPTNSVKDFPDQDLRQRLELGQYLVAQIFNPSAPIGITKYIHSNTVRLKTVAPSATLFDGFESKTQRATFGTKSQIKTS